MALPIRGAAQRAFVAVAVALALALPPAPLTGRMAVSGVANEWSFYGTYLLTEKKSDILRKYLGDLPVCIAFMGAEAHLMYRARIHTAIESEAGLTDRFIAHQALKQRGRIGHEKNAPVDFLIRGRTAHFSFHPAAREILKLDEHILECRIVLDGLQGLVLHWDPALISELRRRGAEVDDLPAKIDDIIAHLSEGPDDGVAKVYAALRLMYFEHVRDPQREAPFRKRLGLAGKTAATMPGG